MVRRRIPLSRSFVGSPPPESVAGRVARSLGTIEAVARSTLAISTINPFRPMYAAGLASAAGLAGLTLAAKQVLARGELRRKQRGPCCILEISGCHGFHAGTTARYQVPHASTVPYRANSTVTDTVL